MGWAGGGLFFGCQPFGLALNPTNPDLQSLARRANETSQGEGLASEDKGRTVWV